MSTVRKLPLVFVVPGLLVLAVVVTLSLRACDDSPDTLVVGAILPVTGNLAFLGTEEENGLRMAVDEVPGWTLVVEDSGAKTFEATVATSRLVSGLNARLLLSTTTRISRAVRDSDSRRGVPLIAFCADPGIANPDESVYRYYYDSIAEMEVLASHVARRQRELASAASARSRVGVMYLKIPPIEAAVRDVLMPRVGPDNITLISYDITTRDFAPLVARLDGRSIGLLCVVEYGFTHAQLLAAVDDANWQAPPQIVGGMGFIWNLQNEQVPVEKLEGVEVVAPMFLLSKNSRLEAFNDRYRERYGRAPTFDAVLSYQALRHALAFASKERSGRVALRDWAGSEYPGPAAGASFPSDGALKVPLGVAAIRSGRLVEVK